MASGFTTKFNTESSDRAFEKLVGPAKESLARRMAVSGGSILRDEAKVRAPVIEPGGYGYDARYAGQLKDAIYLAYRDGISGGSRFTYSITWNAKKAGYGHLLEFGHWMPYVSRRGPDGLWYTDVTQLRAVPLWVPAQPFLRPAYDSSLGRVKEAMIARGREELPKLLKGET